LVDNDYSNGKLEIFPIPLGRNKVMYGFALHTIINLSRYNAYKNGVQLYYSYEEAYFTFCNFIKTLSQKIYGNDSRPYFLEMLLFRIFEDEVLKEMGERISLTSSNS